MRDIVRLHWRGLLICAALVALSGQAVADAPPAMVAPAHTVALDKVPKGVAFGPTGSTLLISWNGKVHIVDVSTGKESSSTNPEPGATSLVPSSDGKRVACGGDMQDGSILDLETGKALHSIKLPMGFDPPPFSWSADGKRLACAVGAKVFVFNPDSGEVVSKWEGPDQASLGIGISADGSKVAGCRSGGGPGMLDGLVYVWNTADGKEASHFTAKSATHQWVCFLDSDTVVTPFNGMTGGAAAVDIATGKAKYIFKSDLPGQSLTSGSLSHDGKLLVTGDSGDGDKPLVQIWQAGTGKVLTTLTGCNAGHVTVVTFSRDDKSVAAICNDKAVYVWSVPESKLLTWNIKVWSARQLIQAVAISEK